MQLLLYLESERWFVDREKRLLLMTGLLFGVFAVVLMVFGNPGNMGFCLSCFIRDIAGSLRLHGVPGVSYMRPEVLGLVIGAFIYAAVRGDFKAVSGSSTVIRFLLGFAMMVGSLTFLGCPVRAVLRLSAGDMNALVGILGLVGGIGVGALCLDNGFSLGRAYPTERISGMLFPLAAIILLGIALFFPGILNGGAPHAPIWMSLAAGLVIGMLAMRTRFCSMGAFRDIFLMKDFTLFYGILGLFSAALVMNIVTGNFHFGFTSQPIAHTEQVWNFLGLFLVGLSAAMAGGCPLRQLILSASGNGDSVVTVLGLVAGAAFCHNYGYAASPAGVPLNGKIMVVVLLVLVASIAAYITLRNRKALYE